MYVCSEYAKYIIKYIIDKMHQTPFSAYIRVNPSVDCYPNRSEVQKRKYRMLFNRKNHLSPDPSSRHRCYAGVNCIYIYIYQACMHIQIRQVLQKRYICKLQFENQAEREYCG